MLNIFHNKRTSLFRVFFSFRVSPPVVNSRKPLIAEKFNWWTNICIGYHFWVSSEREREREREMLRHSRAVTYCCSVKNIATLDCPCCKCVTMCSHLVKTALFTSPPSPWDLRRYLYILMTTLRASTTRITPSPTSKSDIPWQAKARWLNDYGGHTVYCRGVRPPQ